MGRLAIRPGRNRRVWLFFPSGHRWLASGKGLCFGEIACAGQMDNLVQDFGQNRCIGRPTSTKEFVLFPGAYGNASAVR